MVRLIVGVDSHAQMGTHMSADYKRSVGLVAKHNEDKTKEAKVPRVRTWRFYGGVLFYRDSDRMNGSAIGRKNCAKDTTHVSGFFFRTHVVQCNINTIAPAALRPLYCGH